MFLFHIAHTRNIHVTTLYSMMVLWKYLKAPKDGIPDPRGTLVNEVPSRAIEQAILEVRQLRSANRRKGKRGAYKRYIWI